MGQSVDPETQCDYMTEDIYCMLLPCHLFVVGFKAVEYVRTQTPAEKEQSHKLIC